MPNPKDHFSELFKTHFSGSIISIEALAQSGSYRQYYRLKSDKETVLGVYNTDLQENKAYLSFTKTFWNAGIAVPEIYEVSDDQQSYLVEDLGSESLWDCAQKDRKLSGDLSEKTLLLYQQTLKELLQIQTKTITHLDLSYCYPRDAFDKQSMLWDLNYFKYFFLRLMRVNVDEQKLEEDIQRLASDLDTVDQNFFLYRDFQSRNVMVKGNKTYFIDFQGGRRGALYYDVASLLYDANVELNDKNREELLAYYYAQLNTIQPTDWIVFKQYFTLFAIIRLTQALGAFGLRGVVEKKPHFKTCIPFALESLNKLIATGDISSQYPTLCNAIFEAYASAYIHKIVTEIDAQ